MVDHDGAFKVLLATFFREFLELFAPALAAQLVDDDFTFLTTESFADLVDTRRRNADLVVETRLRAGNATILVHLEHQAQDDSVLARRMFRYFGRFHERYDVPIYPIALCSYPSPRIAVPAHYAVAVAPLDVLHFQFQVVQLSQLRWRAYLDTPNPVAVALMARMDVAPQDRWRVKAACLRRAIGLPLSIDAQRLIAQFVDQYLPLDPVDDAAFRADVATYSQPEQEGIMEFVTSWQRQGREEGRKEGREEGREEAARTIVLQLAHKRFGVLDAATTARITDLDPHALDALVLALLDFTSAADLTAWLDAQSTRPRHNGTI